MVLYDKAHIDRLRAEYPEGTRIELIHTDDRYTRLQSGDLGKVKHVDDAGTLHVSWDCGSSLGLIPGVDSFKKIEGGEAHA